MYQSDLGVEIPCLQQIPHTLAVNVCVVACYLRFLEIKMSFIAASKSLIFYFLFIFTTEVLP